MVTALSRREVMRQARGLALATPFLSLLGCDGRGGRSLTRLTGATMGTGYSVKIPGLPAGLDGQALERDIAAILGAVDRRMSTYRPESELSRFNGGGAGMWHPVSGDTRAVVAEALRVSRLSRGAFDATVGPLVELWGFGPGGGGRALPSRRRIADGLRRLDHHKVRTRASPPALAKEQGDLRVDLSGIAKGFGVDKVTEHLRRLGIRDYLVEVGGEFSGRGYSPRGDGWRIGIEKPDSARPTVRRVVRLGDRALATSGDYRIFFEHGGARYSHIIDPRDGRPVAHGLASVTVVAPSTMAADALSTALMVLGPERGLDLARREGIAAFFIAKRGDGFVDIASPAFAPYLSA